MLSFCYVSELSALQIDAGASVRVVTSCSLCAGAEVHERDCILA